VSVAIHGWSKTFLWPGRQQGRKVAVEVHGMGNGIRDKAHATGYANMVGSSREMVNKSLRYLEDQKALRTTRKGIEILDGKMLENIAQAIGVHSK
jgi:hypothetical protein